MQIVKPPQVHPVVVIGSGASGGMAAWNLTRQGIEVLLLDAGDKFEAAYPYPIHAWRFGNEMLVIGMGAETVVDYAIRFKHEFGPGTWVCGYADDMIAYIPSRRVWEEGGYEGGSNLYEYGRPAFRWDGGIEDRIAASVQRVVKKVKE